MTEVMIALAVWLVLRKLDAFASRLFLVAMLPAGVIILPSLAGLGMIWMAERLGDWVYWVVLAACLPLPLARIYRIACALAPILWGGGGGGGGSDHVEV